MAINIVEREREIEQIIIKVVQICGISTGRPGQMLIVCNEDIRRDAKVNQWKYTSGRH